MESSSDVRQQRYSTHHHHHHIQDLHQRQFENNSGLSRFRSAPSSYLDSLMESVVPEQQQQQPTANTNSDDFHLPRPLSPETESIISRFIHRFSGGSSGMEMVTNEPPATATPPSSGMGMVVKCENEQMGVEQESRVFSSSSRKKPPLAGGHRSGGMDRVFSPVSMKTGYGSGLNGSNERKSAVSTSLVRHSSSPAGLFDDIHIEKGYLVSRGSVNTSNIGSSPFRSSTTGGSSPITTQTPRNLPVAPTVKRVKTETSSIDEEGNYLTGFPVGSWDDTMFSDLLYGGSEREISGGGGGGGGGEVNNHPSLENQKSPGKGRSNNNSPLLAHHMSLPKETLEKLLQFEDSVPCKIRAKRGCATHPRSIAERVRRTKISDRMRKLQDVVPNMDKQTSTADMLDLAVDHIKNLQNQLQILNGKRARCTCPI